MADVLVLDANAFNARGFVFFLERYRGIKILPAVAAGEWYYVLCRHRGWPPERFYAELGKMGVEVESLDAELALVAASAADETFKTKKADWLIGAHALHPGRILVTFNVADYPQVRRKMTPLELMAKA